MSVVEDDVQVLPVRVVGAELFLEVGSAGHFYFSYIPFRQPAR
jgi:hypothetical protein